MDKNLNRDVLATFITNGFHINNVQRISNGDFIINTYRYDKLGGQVRYSILFTEASETDSLVKQLVAHSSAYKSNAIVVSDTSKKNDCVTYSKTSFFEFFGGLINTGLILISRLPDILDELGHKKLPSGLSGKPEDLHELYISECFQFSLESPTRRYGIDRSFESLPDGVILGRNRIFILLDSKSYSNGFSFELDDIKRFASYIEDFNRRYSMFFGTVFAFVVVTGHFNDSSESLKGRSDELYRICNTRLSCISSRNLGDITQLLLKNPDMRRSIEWKNIFSKTIIEVKHVQAEIDRIIKDKLY